MSREPWFGLQVEPGPAHLAVFGVPFDSGVFFRRGAAAAPDRIRELSSHLPPVTDVSRSLQDRRIADLGNVQPGRSMRSTSIKDWTATEYRELEDFHAGVRWCFRDARKLGLPLALGGDHSISIPLLYEAAELAGGDFGVLWIDAHPDLCDRYDGSAFSHACVMRRALEIPGLKPENVVMLGIRSREVEEADFIRDTGLSTFGPQELLLRSAYDVAIEIAGRFGDLPVLSIDIDAFDPAFAPGTGIPDAGGLTSRWVIDLLPALAPLRFIGVDIVEVAPSLDTPSDTTSLLALKLIVELLGAAPSVP
jgi:agmatinase